MRQMGRWMALALVAVTLAGCATSQAIGRAETAANRGDWDSAVAYYREALGNDPENVEVRIALERATRTASSEHMRRARDLEAQDQLAGAMAEYKLAAELDPTSVVALAKANEIERRMRELAEATRPRPRIEAVQQQAQQTSPIPRLDPRTVVPRMSFPSASVRDLLRTISDLTKLNIQFDQGLDATLSRTYPIDLQETPLEQVLTQILSANTLTFKVLNAQTIFIYSDTPNNRQRYEDQYVQTFYISSADPQELVQILTQTLQQGPAIAPRFTLNKSANAIVVRATAPVMQLIETLIRANDRPRAEVMIEAEILEVSRRFTRELGLDLSQFALGFTFSPELAPPNTGGVFPPAVPPPFNLNTISRGVSPAAFYMTSPTALIKLLESNSKTRILARPSMRGTAGTPITLRLGDLVPIPQTVFQSAGAGGVATIPTTSVQYQPVGVNLLFTPRVTYQDEVILENMTLEKSGLGNFLTIGGQEFPTIITRTANSTLRLRDGESNLIAGLFQDQDRQTIESLPGLSKLPVLGTIFGNQDAEDEQTDIVMIITPRIVRSHELTAADLKPMYIGTGQNIGAGGGTPQLISPEALAAPDNAPGVGTAVTQAPGTLAATAPPTAASTTPSTPAMTATSPATPTGTTTPSAAARGIEIVPIQPVAPAAAPAAPAAPAPSGSVRVVMTAPTAGPDGTLAANGGPYTIPITIAGAPAVSTISLTITYNPAVVRAPTVTQGSFMMQGGVTPTFIPSVDAQAGRIDIAITRGSGQGGASNSGLLAAIAFMTGTAGTTDFTVTGVAASATGQPLPVEITPTKIVVK